MGGFAFNTMLDTVYKYDIEAGTWSLYKGPPTPHGIGVAGAVVIDNRLVIGRGMRECVCVCAIGHVHCLPCYYF